ncbi:hypothetical protein DFP72DRAFT_1046569 [Ephemerocybe angulata]|uniref:Uncharacterized protein n=1 Tax=Ephemerocybe angulata TaxID=980116 RepID=A0A8H6HW63_9AGAR|nr:hypothetical protein DFP72DRAFT_1046569 [Tulosesus angulatus]
MDMSHLTELSVSDIVAANRMTAHQWIEILRKPSRLQVLSLHDAIQDGTIQVTGWSVRPPSKLQHLRLVSLGDRKSTVALRLLSIFCSTLLPPGCGVHLNFPEALAHESMTDAIASLIAPLELHFHHNLNLQASETPQVELDIGRFPWSKHGATLGTVPDPTTTLDWNGDVGIEGVMTYLDGASSSPSNPVEFNPPQFPILSVGIQDLSNSVMVNAAVSLCSFILRNATRLRVSVVDSSSHEWNDWTWLSDSLLIEMPEVTKLILDEGGVVHLMDELRQTAQMVLPWSRTLKVLPRLQHIVLDTKAKPESIWAESDGLPEQLESYVSLRRTLGHPVQVIRSEEC